MDLLSRLTVSEARALDFSCKNAKKTVTPGDLILAEPFVVTIDVLKEITGVSDIHRLHLQLDHLNSLGLFELNSGFSPHADTQSVTLHPSALALQMYTRCHGHLGSPIAFFGLTTPGSEEDIPT